jgi:hypothetical protein
VFRLWAYASWRKKKHPTQALKRPNEARAAFDQLGKDGRKFSVEVHPAEAPCRKTENSSDQSIPLQPGSMDVRSALLQDGVTSSLS